MQKKSKKSSAMTLALMSVISSSAVVTVAMTNAEGDTSRSVVSYYSMSANSYQPINPYDPAAYYPSEKSIQVSSSAKRILSPLALSRKLKQLDRTISSVHKRLLAIEDKIEDPSMRSSFTSLQLKRKQLEDQLASLQSKRAELTMQ